MFVHLKQLGMRVNAWPAEKHLELCINALPIEKRLGIRVNARPTVKFALARPVRRRLKTAS